MTKTEPTAGESIPSPIVHSLPKERIPIRFGRTWLGYRWGRYLLWSLLSKHLMGAGDAAKSIATLLRLGLHDCLRPSREVCCNVCGWEGREFYPNVGSGYCESNTTCPRCHCIQRYRSLVALLETQTEFFSPVSRVLEVAPFRTFQSYSLWRKGDKNYLSFDIGRFAMERGDITAMRYKNHSYDFFLCFHVMEHIMEEDKALAEIRRVLVPGGKAIFQVPIDYSISDTVEYDAPNPFETGHVRRYSTSGFQNSLESAGFSVSTLKVSEVFQPESLHKYALSDEPIYIATNVG